MAKRIVESIQYGGITFPSIVHSEESVHYAHRCFQVRDSAVFNVTYPKSVSCWERVPWVEHKTATQYLESQPYPRLITSHLPATIFLEKFFSLQAKTIYTVRDPKGVCVSLYHYAKMSSFLEFREDFRELIELFSAGKLLFGTWFDHDLCGSVLRICEFLGKNLDPAADSVVENASFGVMKSNKMVNYTMVPEELMDQKISTFLRKGVSGDWKTHFTEEQSVAFHQLYQKNMNGLETNFPWEEFQAENHQEI
ncbi:hypothetical protein Chor_012701 [Crotalus horridus]